MLRGLPTCVCVLAATSFGACASTPSPAALQREADERAAAVERALQERFPEIDGPVTRAAIVRALQAQPEELAGGGLKGDAVAAIAAGDYDRAQRALSELLGERLRTEARAKLDARDPRGALAVLDRAVELSPTSAEIRILRAEAALAVGLEEREPELLRAAEADALAATLRAGTPEAWFTAARVALALNTPVDALSRARSGLDAWLERASHSPAPDGAWRTLADAALAAFELARTEKLVADAQGDLELAFERSAEMARAEASAREALEGEIGRAPEDPWGWQRLAWLAESAGAPGEAQNVALRALSLAPSDEALHDRLAAVTRTLGGADGVSSVYTVFAAAHPRVGLARWHPARARFDEAADALYAGEDSRDAFRAAEEGFVRCRELEPRYADACRGYEVLCRSGVGWCAYRAKPPELDAARTAFLSMEDVFPGGLAWELAGRMASGVIGLSLVGASYAKEAEADPNAPESIERLAQAARIYDYLHAYQPGDVNWANNAGFFNRDVAVALEYRAQALAAQGRTSEAERLIAQARERMETSYRAYVDAATAAPDDTRIQNDTGLILTYYLQRDLDTAERYLRRAVELGEARVTELRAAAPAAGSEAEQTLEDVEIALGDAYQNLGYLYLILKDDPKTARGWFEKCIAAPDPRPEVEGADGLMAQCDRALAGEKRAQPRWGVLNSKGR